MGELHSIMVVHGSPNSAIFEKVILYTENLLEVIGNKTCIILNSV